MSQAIYWACKSSHTNLRNIFENKPTEEIAALEKSISESLSRASSELINLGNKKIDGNMTCCCREFDIECRKNECRGFEIPPEIRLLLSRKEYNLVLISLSASFLKQLVRLIGLNFSGSVHIPSFFGIMMTFGIL